MNDPEKTVIASITALLERRDAGSLPVARETDITKDLGMDSLEVAELSAMLEDDLGSDPYSEGIVPRTVGELIDFYAAA